MVCLPFWSSAKELPLPQSGAGIRNGIIAESAKSKQQLIFPAQMHI